MTDTSRLHESVDQECRNIHDAIIGWQVSAEDGQRWQLMLRALLARAEAAEAERDRLRRTIVMANTLLEKSLFTNSEHRQAKLVLKDALADKKGGEG